ncbi:MAG: hypothetical protein ACI4CT_01095 [Lachnospiraceae bacterium]
MTKLNIEESLRKSIAAETPDLLASLVATPVTKLSEADYIVKQRPIEKHRRSYRWTAAFGSVATAFMLFLVVMLHVNTTKVGPVPDNPTVRSTIQPATVETIVTLDVNPSIELTADADNTLIDVYPLNQDAEQVVSSLDFENASLDDAVISIMEAIADNGYLTKKQNNSILVSVDNSDEMKADEIKTTITDDIHQAINNKNINATVYTQNVTKTEDLVESAENYQISVGKMELIQNLVKQNGDLSLDELASLSIREISRVAEENHVAMSDIVTCDTTMATPKVPETDTDKTTSSSSDTSMESTAQTSVVANDYELQGSKTEAATSAPAEKQPNGKPTDASTAQVISQDENAHVKPAKTAKPDHSDTQKLPSTETSTESFEITDSDSESGEIIE